MNRKSFSLKVFYALSVIAGVLFLSRTPAIRAEGEQAAAPMEMAASHDLDGKAFTGEIGEKGKEGANKDEFIFKDGTFHSTACDAYGFTAAAYTTEMKDGTTMFKATTMSPTDGKMEWQGTMKGDMLEGTCMWQKAADQPVVEHWFKGQMKMAEAGK